MSKSVDYFKKHYDQFYQQPFYAQSSIEMVAAIKVLKLYGSKDSASHQEMAHYMANILSDMIHNTFIFHYRMRQHANPVFTYFIFALQQALGFIDPRIPATEDILMNPGFVMSQEETLILSDIFHRESSQPSQEIQKNLLGVMISVYVNKVQLTPRNSGFASACFVIAKALDLQNISMLVWNKLIRAANFPSRFLGPSSSSRRASEIELIRERRAPPLPIYYDRITMRSNQSTQEEDEPVPSYELPPPYSYPNPGFTAPDMIMDEPSAHQNLPAATPDELPPAYPGRMGTNP